VVDGLVRLETQSSTGVHRCGLGFGARELIAANINTANVTDKAVALEVLCLSYMGPSCAINFSVDDQLRPVVCCPC